MISGMTDAAKKWSASECEALAEGLKAARSGGLRSSGS